MTLQEAINSGRKFKRRGSTEFLTSDDTFDAADVLATDFELAPATTITLTEAELAEAWDDVAASFQRVKSSGESDLFAKLKAYLVTNHAG